MYKEHCSANVRLYFVSNCFRSSALLNYDLVPINIESWKLDENKHNHMKFVNLIIDLLCGVNSEVHIHIMMLNMLLIVVTDVGFPQWIFNVFLMFIVLQKCNC